MSLYQCADCGFTSKNVLKFCPKCRASAWLDVTSSASQKPQVNLPSTAQAITFQPRSTAAQQITAPHKPKGQLAILKPSGIAGLLLVLLISAAAIVKSTESVASFLADQTSMETELWIASDTHDSIRKDPKLFANDHTDSQLAGVVGQRLVAALPAISRYRQKYSFYVVKDDDVNAYAAPAGMIVVHTGLLDLIKRNPDLLAAVLAHEIMHVEQRHGLKSMYQSRAMLVAIAWTFGVASDFGAAPASLLLNTRYSRQLETQADKLGSQLLIDAGWPQAAMPAMLRQLALAKGGVRIPQWLNSHPDSGKRADALEGKR